MATEQINTYDPADNSPEALMDTVDEQRTGYVALSLTEYTTTAVPAIAIGSEIEINGALFKTLDSTDPVTVGGVADGTVYILATPSGVSPDQIATFSFTATAPTWFDSKQGFYNAGGTARYTGFKMIKAGASYSDKSEFFMKDNDNTSFGADGRILLTPDTATYAGPVVSTAAALTLETIPTFRITYDVEKDKYYKAVAYFDLTCTEKLYVRLFTFATAATIRSHHPMTGTAIISNTPMVSIDILSGLISGLGLYVEYRFKPVTSGVATFALQWASSGTASRTIDDMVGYVEPIEYQ